MYYETEDGVHHKKIIWYVNLKRGFSPKLSHPYLNI
jgi:hypothetical protein